MTDMTEIEKAIKQFEVAVAMGERSWDREVSVEKFQQVQSELQLARAHLLELIKEEVAKAKQYDSNVKRGEE